MTTIKIISYISWGLLALLVGFTLAQTAQFTIIDQKLQALSREVTTLRTEQEYLMIQIEGQASAKETLPTPAVQSKVESSQKLTPRGMLHIHYSMPLQDLQGVDLF